MLIELSDKEAAEIQGVLRAIHASNTNALADRIVPVEAPVLTSGARAQVAERIVRLIADHAEATTIKGRVVSQVLGEHHLLPDYMRIRADEQHMAFVPEGSASQRELMAFIHSAKAMSEGMEWEEVDSVIILRWDPDTETLDAIGPFAKTDDNAEVIAWLEGPGADFNADAREGGDPELVFVPLPMTTPT